MSQVTRRVLLSATALVGLKASGLARTVSGDLPWAPNEVYPPLDARPGPWLFLTGDEAAAVDAIVARLIPVDGLGAGAREAGCTTFIDRQLAGPYGGHEWLYMQAPFSTTPLQSQGLQSPLTPREQYRQGLSALAEFCRATYAGRVFAQLLPDEQDKLLTGLEAGTVALPGFDGKMLFGAVYANTIEGFFADPIYGGNKDMAGWQLVGFPGTRYDYRDVMQAPNQRYEQPIVGIKGRPGWDPT